MHSDLHIRSHSRCESLRGVPRLSVTMKAVITTILMLSSSLALAQPGTVAPSYPQYQPNYERDRRLDDNRFDRAYDGRGNPRYDQRAHFRRPVVLASNVSMMRMWNRDQRPTLIDIDARIGGLRRIRLDRQDGRMYVQNVMVVFADGHRQSIAVNQMLSARNPSLVLDLDHGAVTALSIDGNPLRGRATFDVIGLRR
jgi:hypothetical protein